MTPTQPTETAPTAQACARCKNPLGNVRYLVTIHRQSVVSGEQERWSEYVLCSGCVDFGSGYAKDAKHA